MISLYNYVCPLFELFSHNYINKKKFKMSSVINSGLKVKVLILTYLHKVNWVHRQITLRTMQL